MGQIIGAGSDTQSGGGAGGGQVGGGQVGGGQGGGGPAGNGQGGEGPPKGFTLHPGQILAAVGFVLFLVIIGHTGWVVLNRQNPTCALDPKHPPAAKAIAYSPQAEIDVNGDLCVGWQPKALFKTQLDALAVKIDAVQTAKADQAKLRDQAAKAADATAAATAAAALKAVDARLAQSEADLQAAPTAATLVLFIDGRPTPVTFDTKIDDPREWVFQTQFVRAPEDANSDEGKTWRALLAGGGAGGLRDVRVNLDLKDAKPPREDTKIEGLKLRVLSPGWVLGGILAFVAMVAGVLMWGWNTGMLRDAAPSAANPHPTFSLGRVQMAWWFILSLAGFLYVWLVTGQWIGVFTMSVVGLVGISGSTGVAAVAVDAATGSQTADPSGGFFKDLTTSSGGVGLHRVQMLAWTVVLGLIFAWSVLWNFAFPAFDNTLLVLAGLVNGVYVGFKFPENQTPP